MPEKAAAATSVIRKRALHARPQALPRFSGRGVDSFSRKSFSFWGVKALVSRSRSSSRGATSLVLDPQQPMVRRSGACYWRDRRSGAASAQSADPLWLVFPPALRGSKQANPHEGSWHPRAVDATYM